MIYVLFMFREKETIGEIDINNLPREYFSEVIQDPFRRICITIVQLPQVESNRLLRRMS